MILKVNKILETSNNTFKNIIIAVIDFLILVSTGKKQKNSFYINCNNITSLLCYRAL